MKRVLMILLTTLIFGLVAVTAAAVHDPATPGLVATVAVDAHQVDQTRDPTAHVALAVLAVTSLLILSATGRASRGTHTRNRHRYRLHSREVVAPWAPPNPWGRSATARSAPPARRLALPAT